MVKTLIKTEITCPHCGTEHIDRGEFAAEGDRAYHHTHLCVPEQGGCGKLFRTEVDGQPELYFSGVEAGDPDIEYHPDMVTREAADKDRTQTATHVIVPIDQRPFVTLMPIMGRDDMHIDLGAGYSIRVSKIIKWLQPEEVSEATRILEAIRVAAHKCIAKLDLATVSVIEDHFSVQHPRREDLDPGFDENYQADQMMADQLIEGYE